MLYILPAKIRFTFYAPESGMLNRIISCRECYHLLFIIATSAGAVATTGAQWRLPPVTCPVSMFPVVICTAIGAGQRQLHAQLARSTPSEVLALAGRSAIVGAMSGGGCWADFGEKRPARLGRPPLSDSLLVQTSRPQRNRHV